MSTPTRVLTPVLGTLLIASLWFSATPAEAGMVTIFTKSLHPGTTTALQQSRQRPHKLQVGAASRVNRAIQTWLQAFGTNRRQYDIGNQSGQSSSEQASSAPLILTDNSGPPTCQACGNSCVEVPDGQVLDCLETTENFSCVFDEQKVCRRLTAADPVPKPDLPRCPLYTLAEPEPGCKYVWDKQDGNGCPLPRLDCEETWKCIECGNECMTVAEGHTVACPAQTEDISCAFNSQQECVKLRKATPLCPFTLLARPAPGCKYVTDGVDQQGCPIARIECERPPVRGGQCADYVRNDQRVQHCATCGDSICETYEHCTASNCSDGACTRDCGPLYCPQDCEQSSPLLPLPPKPEGPSCGNKICEDGEANRINPGNIPPFIRGSCPQDCPLEIDHKPIDRCSLMFCPHGCKDSQCLPAPSVCGDNVCEGGESAFGCDPVPGLGGCEGHIFCPQDCGPDGPLTLDPTPAKPVELESQTTCRMDARICPDGTSVGRDPSSPNCSEFLPCPTEEE